MDKQKILNNLDISEFYQELIPSLKVNGKPEAVGLCPFHDDTNPSLSVNVETGLYFCPVCNDGGDLFKFYMRHKQVSFKDALRQLSEYSGQAEEKVPSKIKCVYPYTDESGKMLFEVVRYIPKTFRQRRPDGKGGHVYNMEGVRLIPYNLQNVIASDTVYICEGEKDCDNLAKLGLIGTTNPQGAGKWREEFGRYLDGKDVIIICDNDETGKKHGLDVAKKLNGHAKSIKLIEQLPGVPHKGDISDWLKLNQDTPENQKAKLLELVKNAPIWTPKAVENHSPGLVLTRLDALFQEPEETTEWLADGLLPSGGFSVAVAKPKAGKSTLARMLALCVARGTPFLSRDVMQGAVIYLALEEKRSAIRRHFRDMGAIGVEDIHVYSGGTPIDAIRLIQVAVESLKPALVIIDPLFRLTKVKDTNDYAQVTNALDPLLRLARDTGTHVLCVHHANKIDGQGGNCVLGSSAIFGSVDTLMIMRRHEHYRTIETVQRYGEDLPTTILNYDKYTGITTIGREKIEEDSFAIKEAILDFLSNQSEPVIERVINDEVEGRTTLKRKALRELLNDNDVNREGTGGKGDPYRYSCSQKNASSQHVPDFGNKQNNQKNDPVKNACSLVPTITLEQEKKNLKNAGIPLVSRENACSLVPVFPETEKNCREQANLTKNEGENNEPFEVEFLEVVE